MPDLLLELRSEEIPARMQRRAADDLKRLVTNGLVEAGITYEAAAAFATPRRLALSVTGLLARAPDLTEERKGPRVDAPQKAIEGFLRATGLEIGQLEARDDKKGQVYFASIHKPGRSAAEVTAEVVAHTIRTFPWPKSMRWGTGSLRWVRPLHAILCLLSDADGTTPVDIGIEGVPSGDTTEGHRFMGTGRFKVAGFEDYAAQLKSNKVILDANERAGIISTEAQTLAFARGCELVEDAGLLAEVSGLVEWPVVLMGEIDADFLGLPAEVLQTSMREHQKFFSVRNPKTARIEHFITVANRETADDGATILAGNRKVLAARLADARFFWENDLRKIRETGLAGMGKPLENVTFHNKLGTQAERVERIKHLAAEIASRLGVAQSKAREAAGVAKADLASEMVYEFPELQGIMGKYYAQASGLDPEVAEACENHYAPLGPSDAVPTAPVSITVALADKLDMLTGFWAIDEKPTGSKDPYALRRAALGVIRILLENDLRLELTSLVDRQLLLQEIEIRFDTDAQKRALLSREITRQIAEHGVFGAALHALADHFGSDDAAASLDVDDHDWMASLRNGLPAKGQTLLAFFHDRLKVHLREAGTRHDVIDACLALPGNDDFVLLVRRINALSAFLATEDGENLLQGFKRANNILTQAEEKDGVAYEGTPERKFAEDDSETRLFDALDKARADIDPAIGAEDFPAAMAAMAALRAPIDAFFEAVQINTENQIIRRNRLCLLNQIRLIAGQLADVTRIEG